IPIITIIYGEGGSGGALALACGDEVWMLENSTYSILSPEGFASIMWKDSTKADKAAELMQMVPQALLKQGIIEGIIPESEEHRQTCKDIEQVLIKQLNKLQELSPNQLLANRKKRYRKF
ncbi:MAG: acetyl-CoA carboxylase carboxyl transferase subunit alpha, partial [Lactobacillus johnsonii]|nr:acetyl-CoA carboxylase carboxyl transferase subunit alpha [Lactobacillus johnsonii]